MTSLFIEQHDRGIAFYLNGDLQFDSNDEAVYHEYLVIPALALALQRFPDIELRVLICGGGDGLAAREVLRFSQVSQIDLVDYSPEVVELGKTTFLPYNQGSLISDRLTIHCQDAWEFLASVPASTYQVIIGDFTYPNRPEDTKIYSLDWFQQVNLALDCGGIFTTNGVSPEYQTAGFWCLYQTLLAAGFHAKPLQINIPSFRQNGYGSWGFFLAAEQPIKRGELEAIAFPANLQVLSQPAWLNAFKFDSTIANFRHKVNIHCLEKPQLSYYLLNPTVAILDDSNQVDSGLVDFLDLQEVGTGQISQQDLLQLESTAKAWLEHFQSSANLPANAPDLNKLFPLQHHYHSPKMRAEWLKYLKQLLAEIDILRLLNKMLERAQDLPPHIAGELRNLAHKIRHGEPIINISPSMVQFLILLSTTLLMANLVAPDAVFAKGYSSRSSRSSSSSSSGSYANWSSLSPTQSTGMTLFGIGSLLLAAFGLTFIDWHGLKNDE